MPFSDSFDRADGAIGAAWVIDAGAPSIDNKVALFPAGAIAHPAVNTDGPSLDVILQTRALVPNEILPDIILGASDPATSLKISFGDSASVASMSLYTWNGLAWVLDVTETSTYANGYPATYRAWVRAADSSMGWSINGVFRERTIGVIPIGTGISVVGKAGAQLKSIAVTDYVTPAAIDGIITYDQLNNINGASNTAHWLARDLGRFVRTFVTHDAKGRYVAQNCIGITEPTINQPFLWWVEPPRPDNADVDDMQIYQLDTRALAYIDAQTYATDCGKPVTVWIMHLPFRTNCEDFSLPSEQWYQFTSDNSQVLFPEWCEFLAEFDP